MTLYWFSMLKFLIMSSLAVGSSYLLWKEWVKSQEEDNYSPNKLFIGLKLLPLAVVVLLSTFQLIRLTNQAESEVRIRTYDTQAEEVEIKRQEVKQYSPSDNQEEINDLLN